MLYIVSTPIGHLKDITLRAIEVLKAVDLIAAEDTRHTAILCREYGITAQLISNFDHNEQNKAKYFLELLKAGKNIALVSDAGTPGISDPGFRLIRLAKENAVPMTVIPGVCAAVAALTLSGLPSDEFVFKGFLPVKPGARRKKLQEVFSAQGTVIFYESPHRILKTLGDIVEVLGDPMMVVTREITKKFEERLENKASALVEHFTRHKPLGEFILLIPRGAGQDGNAVAAQESAGDCVTPSVVPVEHCLSGKDLHRINNCLGIIRSSCENAIAESELVQDQSLPAEDQAVRSLGIMQDVVDQVDCIVERLSSARWREI